MAASVGGLVSTDTVTHTGDLQEVPELLLSLLLELDHCLLILVHQTHHLFHLGQQLQGLLLTNHSFTVKNKQDALPWALGCAECLPEQPVVQ